MNTKRLSFGLSPELAKKLATEAKRDGRTQAAQIRYILTRWIDRRPFETLDEAAVRKGIKQNV